MVAHVRSCRVGDDVLVPPLVFVFGRRPILTLSRPNVLFLNTKTPMYKRICHTSIECKTT